MKVLYILNDSLFYKRMTLFSIHTFQKYNQNIPVEILLVKDSGINNRDVNWYAEKDWGLGHVTQENFVSVCESLNVKVCEVHFDNGEETGFHSSLRGAFVKVEGEDILLVDSDTFFFGSIHEFFDYCVHYDIVADKSAWSWAGLKLPMRQMDFYQFNSGVVLFRGKLLQEYGKVVHDYCVEIKHERHYLGAIMAEFERQHNPEMQVKFGREEMAFSLWVVDNSLKYKYFGENEVQTRILRGHVMPKIFHTEAGSWAKYWQRYFGYGNYKHPTRWLGRPTLNTLPTRVKVHP